MSKLYFKVLNFVKAGLTIFPNRLESMEDYIGEYNWELENDYFENTWFYSNSDPEQIEFQVYFTKYDYFKYAEFYTNPQAIQDYYQDKYKIPFFQSLLNEDLQNVFFISQVERHLNLDDFKSVILPNFKLNLISVLDFSKLKNDAFYIFYNWNFFEEVSVSPFSNSFLRYLENLPYNSRYNSYKTEDLAKISAVNALLENACSTPDTLLKGLHFNWKNFNSKLFGKDRHYERAVTKIRSLRSIGIENDVFTNVEFKQDLENCLKTMEKNTMKPFEINKG